jgi:hypothetical protein
MITTPTPPATRWIIRRSGFPFSSTGGQLGTCLADTKSAAERLAAAVFGGHTMVERETDPFEADPFPYHNPAKDQAAELLTSPRAMRIMTPIEVQMARALGCARVAGPARGTVRRLHAESFKPTPEISDQLAAKLRQLVHQHRGQLPAELVESIGDTNARGAA